MEFCGAGSVTDLVKGKRSEVNISSCEGKMQRARFEGILNMCTAHERKSLKVKVNTFNCKVTLLNCGL